MTNKERYAEWVGRQEYVPLMMQPWWMDAVCAGKQWDVLLAEDAGGQILAAMPYLLCKRLGLRYVVMPQQTQVGGIWLDDHVTADRYLSSEVCRQLRDQLRQLRLSYYYQQFPPDSFAIDAMRALGFRVRERVTYRVDDLSDMTQVVASFSKNKRRQLQKAEGLHVERGMSAEDFYRFHTRCLAEQRKQTNYSREFLLVLDRKAKRLGQSEILSICDAEGRCLAAAYLVWDRRTLYYLIPCYSLSHSNSGAGALLALEAMRLAKEKHVRFDFEGSMDPGTANHYRQFGSTPYKYYSVERCYNPLFRLFLLAQRLRERRFH